MQQEDCITIDIVRNAIKEIKKENSPGDDGIPVEVVKASGECVLRHMLKICNLAYVSEIAPFAWQRGIISPLFKKCEKSV